MQETTYIMRCYSSLKQKVSFQFTILQVDGYEKEMEFKVLRFCSQLYAKAI